MCMRAAAGPLGEKEKKREFEFGQELIGAKGVTKPLTGSVGWDVCGDQEMFWLVNLTRLPTVILHHGR